MAQLAGSVAELSAYHHGEVRRTIFTPFFVKDILIKLKGYLQYYSCKDWQNCIIHEHKRLVHLLSFSILNFIEKGS